MILAVQASNGGSIPLLGWVVLGVATLLGLYLLVKLSGFMLRSLFFAVLLAAFAAAAWFLWLRH